MSGKPGEQSQGRRSVYGLIFGAVGVFLLLRYTISLERQSGGFKVGLKGAPVQTVEDHASEDRGIDLRLEWKGKAVPPTKMLRHYPGAFARVSTFLLHNIKSTDGSGRFIGWTIFDRLYMLNGTQYVVSDTPDDIPHIRYITSTGYPIENGEEEIAKREPTDEHMRVISTRDAARLFGSMAHRFDGVTVGV